MRSLIIKGDKNQLSIKQREPGSVNTSRNCGVEFRSILKINAYFFGIHD